MKQLFCAMIFGSILISFLKAQNDQLLTFEALGLPLDTFWNGSDLSGSYNEGYFHCPNQYDTNFGGYWSAGFAVSTMRDTLTQGYINLYSSITGGGFESSSYGVVNAYFQTQIEAGSPWIDSFDFALANRWMEFYITNSTYAYYSMKYGDGFGKKFGGITGNDPDFFKLKLSFDDSLISPDIDVFLADFRFSDNSQDYIVKDWIYVDLNNYPAFETLGNHLKMQLFSSDTSAFGMNTPAFFCFDNLRIDFAGGVNELQLIPTIQISVWPESFQISSKISMHYQLITMQGELISGDRGTKVELNTSGLAKGVYILNSSNGKQIWSQKVLRW